MLSRQIKQSFARNLGHTANVFGQQGAAYSWQKEAMRAGEEEKQLEKAKPLDEFFGIYKGVELKNEGTEMLPKKLIDVGHFYSMRVGPQKPLANIPRRKTQQPRRQRQYENRQVTGVRPPTEALLKVEEKEAKQTPIGRLVKEYDRQRDILAELNRLNDQFAAAADYVGHSTAGTFGEFISFADKKAMLIADAVRRITVLEPDQREAAYAKAMRHFDNMTFATYMARKAGVTGTTPEMQEELRILEERMGQGSLRRHRQYLANHAHEAGQSDDVVYDLGDEDILYESMVQIEELPDEPRQEPRLAEGEQKGLGEEHVEEKPEQSEGLVNIDGEEFRPLEAKLVEQIKSNYSGNEAERSVYLSGVATNTLTALVGEKMRGVGAEEEGKFTQEAIQKTIDNVLQENKDVNVLGDFKERLRAAVIPQIRQLEDEDKSHALEALFLLKTQSRKNKKDGKFTNNSVIPITTTGKKDLLGVAGLITRVKGVSPDAPEIGHFVTTSPLTMKHIEIDYGKGSQHRRMLRAVFTVTGNVQTKNYAVKNVTRTINLDLAKYEKLYR